jgi:rRNA maturation protein Rpf1
VIALSTGRQTSQRLNSLLKELDHTIPNARVVRRGKSSLNDLSQCLLHEGHDYAIILHRWHDGPGRIDFSEVGTAGLTPHAPSVLLRSVKLHRECPHRGTHVAQAVTYDPHISEATGRFVQHLSAVMSLNESTLPVRSEITSTFHVSDGSVLLALTSPPAKRDVGPRLLVSRLIWDLHD